MADNFSTFNRLHDGSVCIGYEELDQLKEELASQPVIERLLHPEVRYEVTNRCNATCIMCPRDKHDRAQSIMCGHDAYEKRAGEGGMLNEKKETLIGFCEPLLDKKLERKVVCLHLTINFLYYGIPK